MQKRDENNHEKNRELNPSGILHLFDKAVGVFVQLFDPKLLTLAIAVLVGYCTLFTQRKFPDRWMLFIFYGLLLLMLVTLTARTPDLRRRLRWRPDMAALWFAMHGMMLVSGFFNEDWLPEAVSLLVAYPFVFAVFSAREDHDTFQAITRGAVFAITPFLLWSYVTKPIVWGYPGYHGVFYNANGMAMCSIVLAVCSLLLCQARWFEGRKKSAAAYGLVFLLASFTILLTWSRSAWLTYLGVLFVMVVAYAVYQAKHRVRILASLGMVTVVAVAGLGYVTYVKTMEVIQEDYIAAQDTLKYYDFDLSLFDPETRQLTLGDFTSDRLDLWHAVLTHLTWNGHSSSVVEEWAAIDGGDRRLNAHNSFMGVTYNHGWIAGLLFFGYVALSLWRAVIYYRTHRHRDTLAITPLAITVCFIMESIFESVYAPFSVVGCLYLLVQGVLWRREDAPEALPPEKTP